LHRIGIVILFLVCGLFGILTKGIVYGISKLVLKFGWIDLVGCLICALCCVLVVVLVIVGFFETNEWIHNKLSKKKKG